MYGARLIRGLGDERLLEFFEELQGELVFRRESLLADYGLHRGGVAANGVLRVELV